MCTINELIERLRRPANAPRASVASLYLDLRGTDDEDPLAVVHDACSAANLLDSPDGAALAERLADLLAELPYRIEDALRRGHRALIAFVGVMPPLEECVTLDAVVHHQLAIDNEPDLQQLLALRTTTSRTAPTQALTG